MSTKNEKVETFTIKSAARHLNMSEVYIRRAVQTGKLPSRLVKLEGRETSRHEITLADLEAWRKSAGTHSKREDGRNKLNLYATPEEREAIEKLLSNAKIEALIVKPVQHAKKAAATAEAEE